MKIYNISGLGANELVYEHLVFSSEHEMVNLPWIQPLQNETIASYAERMASIIDDSKPFALMGLSFGGIMVQEIARIKRPQKLILISTIKHETEKPWIISVNTKVPIYKKIPNVFFTSDKVINFYSTVRTSLNAKYPNLKRIYTFKDPYFVEWAFEQIIHWKKVRLDSIETIHIHGTRDIVFPISKISNPIRIKGGTHMMIYEKAAEISPIINDFMK
jgi:CxxC motif-containing protein